MTVVHGLLLIILGAAVIIGTVVGGVCLLAKAIADANRHDINTCECSDCKHRRISRYIKNYIGDDDEDLEKQPKYRKKNDPRNQKSGLTATVDLRQGNTVRIGEDYYRVTGIIAVTGGVRVVLQNLTTKLVTFHKVKLAEFKIPMWMVRPSDWQKPERPK
jgi:hypothetical protein